MKQELKWQSDAKNSYGTLLVPDTDDPVKNLAWSSSDSDHRGQKETLIVWEKGDPKTKRIIWKNTCLVGLAWFFFFMGMNPMTLVQSSLNHEGGIGVATLAVKNSFMILGSLAATSVLFALGCKRTLVITGFLYSVYVVANFYPTWYTMIPAGCISGMAATIFWTAQRVYLARLAHLYSRLYDVDEDRIQSRIFVTITIFYKLSATFGNAASSGILGTKGYQDFMNSARLMICGAAYCNQDLDPQPPATPVGGDDGAPGDVTDLYAPGQGQIYGLCAFCLTSCLVGVCILFLVDPLTKLGLPETPDVKKSMGSLMMEAVTEMRDFRHVLLVPLAMMATGGDSFWAADFSKAFITCAIGIQFIGYVSVWNGISGAFSSLIFGWFNKKTVRSVPFAFCTILQVAVLTMMFVWTPHSNNYLHMSVFAVFWFLGSGVRTFVTPALYATLFSHNLEAAFSIYHIWGFGASTLVFAWSNLLCMATKMYFLLGLLGISFLGYVLVEILDSKRSRYEPLKDDAETSDYVSASL